MHKRNITRPTSATVADPLHQSLIADIDSICDDPIGRSLEKRRPKKYYIVWVESHNRPVIWVVPKHPKYGCLELNTKKNLAQDSLQDFRKAHRWNPEDLSIRRMTLLEAFELCRGMPTPVKLVRRMGTVQEIIAVIICGVRSYRVYSL